MDFEKIYNKLAELEVNEVRGAENIRALKDLFSLHVEKLDRYIEKTDMIINRDTERFNYQQECMVKLMNRVDNLTTHGCTNFVSHNKKLEDVEQKQAVLSTNYKNQSWLVKSLFGITIMAIIASFYKDIEKSLFAPKFEEEATCIDSRER